MNHGMRALRRPSGKADQYARKLSSPSCVDANAGRREIRSRLFVSCGLRVPDNLDDLCFIIACQVVLGLPVFTKDGQTASGSPPCQVGLEPGARIFHGASRRELVEVEGLRPPVRYHSLVAQRDPPDGLLKLFREFVIFHGTAILPKYILAYEQEVWRSRAVAELAR
ncbi:unnamed protein product [Symbiodinium natans]|uniref:Uncharacterized protein n=1 Tax=Symbiodinium natans TaxID=878477 RepID=A0A812SMH9_9DINO|nr:unnamed protein product [Symbiodinium natans]